MFVKYFTMRRAALTLIIATATVDVIVANTQGPVIDEIMKVLLNKSNKPKAVSYTNCPNVFLQKSEAAFWPPPKWNSLPEVVKDQFTMHGTIEVDQTWYIKNHYNGGKGKLWTADYVNEAMQRPITCGGYNTDSCAIGLEKYKHLIQNKVGIVLGSESPWAEAALLTKGATHVSTIKYAPLKSEHPVYHPTEVLLITHGYQLISP